MARPRKEGAEREAMLANRRIQKTLSMRKTRVKKNETFKDALKQKDLALANVRLEKSNNIQMMKLLNNSFSDLQVCQNELLKASSTILEMAKQIQELKKQNDEKERIIDSLEIIAQEHINNC